MADARAGSRIVAVAGNLGAGKSTLVDGLCRRLGWDRCPQQSPDPAYVERIHTDPTRWSFEAQLNFLVMKASALRAAWTSGRNVVVDRSVYEDREVMAQSWSERYWDSDAQQTYSRCAALLLAELPVPDAVIYCDCSHATCEARRLARPRRYQTLYDPTWVARLDELYSRWLTDFDACPLLQLDTDGHDIRDARIVDDVVRDLETYFAPAPSEQSVLFDYAGHPPAMPLFDTAHRPPALRILRPMNDVVPRHPGRVVAPRQRPGVAVAHPSVYVAAPFTSAAVLPQQPLTDLQLDVGGHPHGVLPGDYRLALERIGDVFERDGIQAIIPHRDVNAWGARSLGPRDVILACLDYVRDCDGFIGLLGTSFGAHVEMGMAVALSKPCIAVDVREAG